MATQRTLSRLQTFVWVFLYGGLLTLVLGLATRDYDADTAWVLVAIGGIVAFAGFILIFVRARFQPESAPSSGRQP